MGRKKISEKNPEAIQRLFSVYYITGSQREAASRAGMTTRTARKYFHQRGLYPKRGTVRGKFYPNKLKGKFPTWIRDNPGVDLANKTLDQIAALSGCKKKEIQDYLWRIKRATEREIASLPDLREFPGAIPNTNETLIPFGAWRQYAISRQGYTRKIHISALLKNGTTHEFDIHLDALWAVIAHQKERTLLQ